MKKSKEYSVGRVLLYVLQGLTIYRALVYAKLQSILPASSGSILDIAAGKDPLYHSFLQKSVSLIKGDIKQGSQNIELDMNKPFSYEDNSFDHLLCVNALYIVKDVHQFLSECKRVLKPGGSMVLISPFISNEMPDPDDFRRFTEQGLQNVCKKSGLVVESTDRLGDRFTSAFYLLHPFFIFALIRLPFALLSLILDALIPHSIKSAHPTPLGYCVVLRKL